MLARFAQRELTLDYVYDPPLDLYALGLAEVLPSPRAAWSWSRDVLPVDPLCADRFLALLRESPEHGRGAQTGAQACRNWINQETSMAANSKGVTGVFDLEPEE